MLLQGSKCFRWVAEGKKEFRRAEKEPKRENLYVLNRVTPATGERNFCALIDVFPGKPARYMK